MTRAARRKRARQYAEYLRVSAMPREQRINALRARKANGGSGYRGREFGQWFEQLAKGTQVLR